MFFDRVKIGLAVICAVLFVVAPAASQQFPSRPIRIVLGFGPGGSADTALRLYGQKMSDLLGVPVIIENRPGGNQLIAIRTVLNSEPDGYTLFGAVGGALANNPALRTDLPYDPLKDFSYIGMVAINPGLIVTNVDLPIRTLGEFVAYAKVNSGKLNYVSAGQGTVSQLSAQAFLALTGIEMVHVPYKSDAEMLREIMSGSAHLGFVTTLNSVGLVQTGKVRALAAISNKRLSYLPDVPSVAETDVKLHARLDLHTFASIVGPAGMPAEHVTRLNDAIRKISAMPDVVKLVRETLFSEPGELTPAEFRALVERELAKWRDLGSRMKSSN